MLVLEGGSGWPDGGGGNGGGMAIATSGWGRGREMAAAVAGDRKGRRRPMWVDKLRSVRAPRQGGAEGLGGKHGTTGRKNVWWGGKDIRRERERERECKPPILDSMAQKIRCQISQKHHDAW